MKKKKIVAIVFGTPHFYASCNDCSWMYEDHRDRETGYKEIRKHVSKTGHTVHLEKGVHTNYKLDWEIE